jgi:6-phosphogluconolactonase (cycloisomerase 2 family)
MKLTGSLAGMGSGSHVEIADHRNQRLTLAANGTFELPQDLAIGEPYHVRVLRHRSSPDQVCRAESASGIAQAPVPPVQITCQPGLTLGGTVQGMLGSGLSLRNNGGPALDIQANGSFTFPDRLAPGASYRVEVVRAPNAASQSCTVTDGEGKADSGDVSSVEIRCVNAAPHFLLADSDEVLRLFVYDAALGRFRAHGYRVGNVGAALPTRVYPAGAAEAFVVTRGNTIHRLDLRSGNFTDLEISRLGGIVDRSWALHPNSRAFYIGGTIVTSGQTFTSCSFGPQTGTLECDHDWSARFTGRGNVLKFLPSGTRAYSLSLSPLPVWTYSVDPLTGQFSDERASGITGTISTLGTDDYVEGPGGIHSVDPLTGRLTPLVNQPAGPIGTTGASTAPPGSDLVYLSAAADSEAPAFARDEDTGILMAATAPALPAGMARQGTYDAAGKRFYGFASGFLRAFAIAPGKDAFSELPASSFSLAGAAADFTLAVDPSGEFLYVHSLAGLRILKLDATGALESQVLGPEDIGTNAYFTKPVLTPIASEQPATFVTRFVYVTNEADNSVSQYRLQSDGSLALMGTISTGGIQPGSAAIDPRNRFLYVLNRTSADVAVFAIDADSGTLSAIPGSPFATLANPASLTISDGGTHAYVSGGGTLVRYYAINDSSGALESAMDPDYDTKLSADTMFPHPGFPIVLALSRATNQAIAFANPWASTDNTQLLRIQPSLGGGAYSFGTGGQPAALVVDSIGRALYVANAGDGTISQYSLGSHDDYYYDIRGLGNAVSAGGNPGSLAVDVTDRFLFAANRDTNDISVYGISPTDGSLQPIAGSPFAACGQPASLAVEFAGHYLLVACSADATLRTFEIDPITGVPTPLAGSAATGSMPVGISLTRQLE